MYIHLSQCTALQVLVGVWMMLCVTSLTGANDLKDQEYCEFETLEASCPSADEVVVMAAAKYGRMALGRCVVADLGFLGCSADVLDLADRRCSGRRSCQLRVPDEGMTRRSPCLKELKTYLKASYYCQKIISVERPQCHRCDFVKVTEPMGYLGNVVTEETGCGAPDCPWRISVMPGQRINVTLINFAWDKDNQDPDQLLTPEDVSGGCRVFGTIKEETATRSSTVCGARRRQQHVYTSVTNSVELRIVGKNPAGRDEYFMFKYEAVGCPDPLTPRGGWSRRHGEKVTMGCNDSSVTWTQHCSEEGQWRGETGSCALTSHSLGVLDSSGSMVYLPYGLSVGVVTVVAATIGCLILIIGLVIVRRRKAAAAQMARESLYQIPPPPSYKESISTKTGNKHTNQHYERRVIVNDVTSGGNSYNHIWQRPLPEEPVHQNTPSPYQQRPGQVQYGYNTIESVKQPTVAQGAERAGEILTPQQVLQHQGSIQSASSAPGAHGSSELPLPPPPLQEYGNHTMARRECEPDFEPRYFHIDPDELSAE